MDTKFYDLLLRVLDQPEGERRTFLEAHGADPATCAELLDLINRERELTGFLARPEGLPNIQTTPDRPAPTSGPHAFPETIGPYTIKEILGEGGMGVVYLAEQHEPVQRQLAVKVVRAELTTPEAAVRFAAERQALARLSHPNIAQLYEAGTTDEGYPYFAMEHFPGVSVTEFCDRQRLSVEQRLTLFTTICEAVQHAHQRGIIHRDLKPSNILVAEVDGYPVAKVIDFGIAKAVDQPLTDALELTGERVIGTPAYMSPESLRLIDGVVDVDTRTDVYSLGVLLYELLAGVSPFAIRGATMAQVVAKIANEDAPRLSTRLSSETDATQEMVANQRRTEIAALRRTLTGDLDWIVDMAIAKNRDERYASAAELGADVERHLTHQPVLAGPPSISYRVGKFVRRYRALVAVGIVAFLALVAGTIGTTVGMLRASHEAGRANREAAVANEVSEFMVGLFEVSDPSQARGNSITARELLDTGSERIETELVDQPLVQARLMDTMGKVYTALGLYDQATPLLKRGLDLRRSWLGDGHPNVATSLINIVTVLETKAEYDAAMILADEALVIRRKAFGDEHPEVADSLKVLASLNYLKGEYNEAETLFHESLEMNHRLLGDDNETTAETHRAFAQLLMDKGDLEAAEAHFLEALATYRRVTGDDHPAVVDISGNLAMLAYKRDDFDRAEALYREAIAGARHLFGDHHINTVSHLNNLAMVVQDKGDLEEAETLYREVISTLENIFGPDHRYVATTRNNLATLLEEKGDLKGAEQLLREAHASLRITLGDEHPDIAILLTTLASLLTRQGEFEAAVPVFHEALDMKRRLLGDEHPSVASTVNGLAYLHQRMGDYDTAEQLFREALASFRRIHGEKHGKVAMVLANLANLMDAKGESAEAEPLFIEALAIQRELFGNENPRLVKTIAGLARVVNAQGRSDEAEVLAREAVTLARKALPAGHWEITLAEGILASCLTELGRYAEAEELLLAHVEALRAKQGKASDNDALSKKIETLVDVYTKWGKPEKAAEYR